VTCLRRVLLPCSCRQREDVQAAAKLSNFPPVDMTTALISLKPRCMYAQLMQAEYAAPKSLARGGRQQLRPPTTPTAQQVGTARGGCCPCCCCCCCWGCCCWGCCRGTLLPAEMVRGPAALGQQKALSMGLKLTTGFGDDVLEDGPEGPDTTQQQQQQQQRRQPRSQRRQAASSSSQQDQQVPLSALSGAPSLALLCEQVAGPRPVPGDTGEAQPSTRASCWQQPQQHSQAVAATSRSVEAAAAPARRLQPVSGSGWERREAAGTWQRQQQHPAAAVFPAEDLQEDTDAWTSEEAERLQQQLEQQEAAAAAAAQQKQQRRSRPAAAAGQNSGCGVETGAGSAAGGDERGDPAGGEVLVDAEQLVTGLRSFVQHMSGLGRR